MKIKTVIISLVEENRLYTQDQLLNKQCYKNYKRIVIIAFCSYTSFNYHIKILIHLCNYDMKHFFGTRLHKI